MTLTIIFAVSGFLVLVILFAKILEMRSNQKPLILKLISKGDESVRDLTHKSTGQYSFLKEKLSFFFKRQLPLHSKNIFYKGTSVLKSEAERLRNSKFLKKKDGISEFLKNLSEKENGGNIDETPEDSGK